MNKTLAPFAAPMLVLLVGFVQFACKDDDDPEPSVVSFREAATTVDESAGTINVEIVLNRAHGRDARIEYSVGGTASDQDQVGTEGADFQIEGTHGVVDIPAGSTTASIAIRIIDDDLFEEDETIVLHIENTSTNDIRIGEPAEHVVTITSADPQLLASFADTTLTVNEDDEANGFILVEVQLSEAATEDVVVNYTLGGDALDSISGFEQELPPMYYDYHINGESGRLTIPSGQQAANIEILVYTDLMFEDDETIEITLQQSEQVGVGENSTMTITVMQQDGKAIALTWPEETTDVDMDMFLWTGADTDQPGIFAVSIVEAVDPKIELIFLPKIFTDELPPTTFGLSYNYYRGTADPLNFSVQFADFAAGMLEPEADRDIFQATYTAANVFPWFERGESPAIVQTFRIVDGQYTDFSNIMVPSSGSRMKPLPSPGSLKKTGPIQQRLFQ